MLQIRRTDLGRDRVHARVARGLLRIADRTGRAVPGDDRRLEYRLRQADAGLLLERETQVDVGGEVRRAGQLIERRKDRIDELAEVDHLSAHVGVTRVQRRGREKETAGLAQRGA